MNRFFFRFFVITITILIANLLTTALSDYLITYKNHIKPVTFTFLGMGVTVLVFYPLFTKLEEWVKRFSMKFIKSGKGVAGKYLGMLLAFLAALVVLCWFYGKMWYHLDFFSLLLKGDIGRYI